MPRTTTRQQPDADCLSRRALRILDRPALPEYLREHIARSATGDGRYLPLCVAENHGMGGALLARLAAVDGVPSRVLAYDAMTGSLPFRQQLASFLGRTVFGRVFAAEQLAVLAGAGSVLEVLFHALADPGDGVLVPTPSYAGFWPDLELRDELRIVPVPRRAEDGFRLRPDALEQALRSAGRPIRALLLTSPDNPTGRVYSGEELDAILGWATDAGIHVVSDEVYALSVHGAASFVSAARRRRSLGNRLHLVWAFSKDFGASGLRCGVLVSENEALLRAVDALAYWECTSGHTQYLLGEAISDRSWVDGYLAEARRDLGRRYSELTAALDQHRLPYVAADAGFFLLLDLRPFLAAPSWDAEHALWLRILHEAGINLTPGSACRAPEPGCFRLCFGGVGSATLRNAVEGLARVLA